MHAHAALWLIFPSLLPHRWRRSPCWSFFIFTDGSLITLLFVTPSPPGLSLTTKKTFSFKPGSKQSGKTGVERGRGKKNTHFLSQFNWSSAMSNGGFSRRHIQPSIIASSVEVNFSGKNLIFLSSEGGEIALWHVLLVLRLSHFLSLPLSPAASLSTFVLFLLLLTVVPCLIHIQFSRHRLFESHYEVESA